MAAATDVDSQSRVATNPRARLLRSSQRDPQEREVRLPGVYFRMVMIGYFEGIDSERGIAWRCADSLSLKSFLGYALTETTPDHSTVSRTRRWIDLETHARVFTWMLEVLARNGLVDGKTIGIDGTTLEANAAMRCSPRYRR